MGFKDFVKKKIESTKKGFAEDAKRRSQIRTAEREALHEARLKQTKVFAQKKAASETKMRLAPRETATSGFGALAEGILGSAPRVAPVTKKRFVKPTTRKKKKKTKTRIVYRTAPAPKPRRAAVFDFKI